MIYVYPDCESSGLYDDALSAMDPSQPHLLQLAFKVFTEENELVGEYMRIIRPDGWSVQPEAAKVHGITEAVAYRYGVPLVSALYNLKEAVAGPTTKIVGFNLQGFDRKLIGVSCFHAGTTDHWWTKKANDFIELMEDLTPIMKLPGKFGLKQPSLMEAVAYCAERSPDGERWKNWTQRHRAEEDVDACIFIHRSLRHGLQNPAA